MDQTKLSCHIPPAPITKMMFVTITDVKLISTNNLDWLLGCLFYIMHTGDSNDRPYLVNNQTQFVAWAYGPRATEEGLRDLAFFHTEYPRNGGMPVSAIYKCIC